MIEIIPAILPKNYEDLKNKIALVRGLAKTVQVDICDGVFVSHLSWPFLNKSEFDAHFNKILNEQEGMPFWEDIDFELDLMVLDAVSNFDIYMKLGGKRMIFHLEAVGNLQEFRNFLEGLDIYTREMVELGVALNIKTPLESLFPLIGQIDFVQFMGIDKIGFQSEDFDEKVLEKIREFRKKFPETVISVDGGVDFNIAPKLVAAGVNRLVIGSAIFNADDIIGTIEEFKNL